MLYFFSKLKSDAKMNLIDIEEKTKTEGRKENDYIKQSAGVE